MSSSKAKTNASTSRSREKSSAEMISRASDVCQKLDIQPYVLKFWEGEFSQLGKRVGAQRRYDSGALAMAEEIRRLLQEEKRTLGDVRGILASRFPDAAEAKTEVQTDEKPQESDESLAALQERIAALSSENRELRRAAAEGGRRSHALSEARNKLVEMQREVEQQRRRAERMQDAETRARNLEAEAKRLRQECKKAKTTLEAVQDELARAKKKAKTLEKQAEENSASMKRACRETETLKAEVAGLSSECERLSRGEQEVLEVRERLAVVENSEAALKDENERLAAEARTARERERELRSAVAEEIADAVERVNALSAESEALALLLAPIATDTANDPSSS